MKKLNKILPIITIATSASIIPCTITSCNQEIVEPIEMHNLMNEIEKGPTHAVDYGNQTQATKHYISDVQANPEIFVNDACLAAQQLLPPSPTHGYFDEFSFGVSKPTFGTTFIGQYGGEDFEYTTLTASQKFHIKYVQVENGFKDVGDLELQVGYDNVVFYAFEELNKENESVGNLGLFDYSIEDEALGPFISNTEPGSIRYSCSSRRLKYYVTDDNQDILLNNRCSYYSGQMNSGRMLINLIEYAKNLPETGDIYQDMEKEIISVILFDYESNYLSKVKNIPEIKLAHILTGDFDLDAPQLDLLLNGLVFIRPTYVQPEGIEEPSSGDPQFIVKLAKQPAAMEYTHESTEDPAIKENKMTIHGNTRLKFGGATTQFRCAIQVPATLNSSGVEGWDPSITDKVSVLFRGYSTSILKVEMYPREGTEAFQTLGSIGSEAHPLEQDVYLNYDYILQNIAHGIN